MDKNHVVIDTTKNPKPYGPSIFITIYLLDLAVSFVQCSFVLSIPLFNITMENISGHTILERLIKLLDSSPILDRCNKQQLQNYLKIIFHYKSFIFNGKEYLLTENKARTVTWNNIPYVCEEKETFE